MQEFNRARVLSAPVVISPDLEDLEEETVPEERDSTPSLLGWVDVADLVEALISRAHASAVCLGSLVAGCRVKRGRQLVSDSHKACGPGLIAKQRAFH